ncbi:MAG: hypothetical protein HY360_09260 [Verrucomicrobia bacterium]|nr:hypothetical protein [Verrucomicrobiota bacterium]
MNLTLQPRVLRWARERADLDAAALAKKVGGSTTAERVEEWERTGKLTCTQARKLAHVTHTPEGFLYLVEPPDDQLPIPDFRTVSNEPVRRLFKPEQFRQEYHRHQRARPSNSCGC